jgi:rubredoxin
MTCFRCSECGILFIVDEQGNKIPPVESGKYHAEYDVLIRCGKCEGVKNALHS